MSKFRISFLALILAVAIPATGCFGKFALVRKVYGFNASVGDKFLRSLVTWVFVIVPVYSLSTLVDFVIFNTIEFWTGSNPVDSGKLSAVQGDTTIVSNRRIENGKAILEFKAYKKGELLNTVVMSKIDGSALEAKIMDAKGLAVASQVFPMGNVSAEQLASLNAGG
jgi:hypothetical protein